MRSRRVRPCSGQWLTVPYNSGHTPEHMPLASNSNLYFGCTFGSPEIADVLRISVDYPPGIRTILNGVTKNGDKEGTRLIFATPLTNLSDTAVAESRYAHLHQQTRYPELPGSDEGDICRL